MLGGKKLDKDGNVISATSAHMIFMTKANLDEAVKGGVAGVELELADATNLEWEEKLIEMLLEEAETTEEEYGIKMLIHVARR